MNSGVEGPTSHGNEQVVRVGVERCDQRAGSLDPSLQECVVFGYVSDDGRVLDSGDSLRIPVDHDDLLASVAQVSGDLPADPAPAADHYVILHLVDVPFHLAPPE